MPTSRTSSCPNSVTRWRCMPWVVCVEGGSAGSRFPPGLYRISTVSRMGPPENESHHGQVGQSIQDAAWYRACPPGHRTLARKVVDATNRVTLVVAVCPAPERTHMLLILQTSIQGTRY
jgi:hypothetical protein